MEFADETVNLKDKLLEVAITNNYCAMYRVARVIARQENRRTEIKKKRELFEKKYSDLDYCEMFVKCGLLFVDINGIRFTRNEIKKACDSLVETILYIAFMDLNYGNSKVRI